ncbi:MAG: FHA domain-containing protein [Woeseiaceae bacterium]|nr:FHA domain-containing protein [Woeseiaceae bacterium]
MTNEKTNTNELVSDPDAPTAELETLADTSAFGPEPSPDKGPSVRQLKSDLQSRTETINQLQFDIEHLRARWNGLEAEIRAREEITTELNLKLARSERLLKERDTQVEQLRQELEAMRGQALSPGENAEDTRIAGRLASATAEVVELQARLERAQVYADNLRRQLQERSTVADEAASDRDALKDRFDHSRREAAELERVVADLQASKAALEEQLASIRADHKKEIRLIRFELGEAQETVAQQELVTEQLASDLVDTQGFKVELEKMLARSEESSTARIDDLERENRRLKEDLAHSKETLESKSDAINCLLAELAGKSQQIEAIGEIEDVIHDIDDRMSDRIEEHRSRGERDRTSRVLIGTVDGQELRFPLFKDRLTIGRTEQNDIQLKASFVSRRHAVIVTDQDTTRVIDWGSKNGVYVNSVRITEHFLKNGDAVRIGTAEFRYEEFPRREH